MIKRVMVYTYGAQPHENTIEIAAKFAAAKDAQIIGLFLKPDYVNYANVYGQFPLNMTKTFYEHQEQFAEQSKECFERICQRSDCRYEWNEVDQYEPSPKPELYTDCIFISQPGKSTDNTFDEFDYLDSLIIASGTPIIIVPRGWQADTFARCPVLAWKESKEAASATRQSISIMQQADKVDIVSVDASLDRDHELVSGVQIGEYLGLHGIDCTFFDKPKTKGDKHESEVILRHIEDHKNDLLIMGGYSRSRLREIILGGMTRDMLKNCSIPVLMAH